MPGRAKQNDQRAWWGAFGLLVLIGTVWSLSTPLATGPDEVEQGRRAAAVVRGDLIGTRQPGVPPVVVDVRVPGTYDDRLVDHWRCFLGPLAEGSPQEVMPLPPSTCPRLSSSTELTTVQTVQFRGQPFFYAWVGLGTLWPGPDGMYVMRMLSVVAAAALLASALLSARRAGRGRLAGLAVAATVTPMVMYLAASTNPSALETAAAVCAWATGMVLADAGSTPTTRTVARFGISLVVLGTTRGLGPLFAGLVVAGVGVVAGWSRLIVLARRRDVALAAGAVAVGAALSVAWLANISSRWALPARPGTGWHAALGYLPWYLRQAVGVFGTNDSSLPPVAAWVWVVVAVGVLGAGVSRATWRVRIVAGGVLVLGMALQVTAEGLSIPPIGFFWQGRYALPVLVGAVLVAACAAPRPAAQPVDPETTLGPSRLASVATWAAGGVLVGVHVTAFATVLRHYTAEGPGSLALGDALLHPRWEPPLAPVALFVAFALATAGWVTWLLVHTGEPRDADGPA